MKKKASINTCSNQKNDFKSSFQKHAKEKKKDKLQNQIFKCVYSLNIIPTTIEFREFSKSPLSLTIRIRSTSPRVASVGALSFSIL